MRRRSAALLLAAALAVGLAACGDDSGSDTSGATGAPVVETVTETVSTSSSSTGSVESTSASTEEDGAPPAADIEVTSLTGFTSPTGNIGCHIDRRSVRCDIQDRDWEAPDKPAGCKGDFGQGIALDAGGAPAFVCANDSALGSGEPLPYGHSIAAGLLRCESEEAGMTCTDTETGRTFSLAKEAYAFG